MEPSPAIPLTERQAYWLKHIEACKASGQRIADYALAQGINAKAMYAGKKDLVKKGVLPRKRPLLFQRARIMGSTAVATDWSIQLPNGVAVVFSGAVDSENLAVILSTAASVK